MKYQFKQAVHIRPKGKPGKAFSLGIHEVDQAFEYDPYFLKLVSAGLIAEAPLSKLAEPVPAEQKSQELLAKIETRRRASVAKSAPKEPVESVEDVDPVSPLVDSVSVPAEHKSDKKKSKG